MSVMRWYRLKIMCVQLSRAYDIHTLTLLWRYNVRNEQTEKKHSILPFRIMYNNAVKADTGMHHHHACILTHTHQQMLIIVHV